MGSIQKVVYYCSVSKGGQLLYAYNNGEDLEIENLSVLCLERIPPFHKWYFQTMAKKTFGFLIEVDGYVFFAIVDEGPGNVEILRFLEQLKDEFRKLAKRGSCWTMSNLNSLCLQEKSFSVILPCRNVDGQIEGGASAKVLLLGKPSRQKKIDHVIAMRDTELEEQQKSTEQVMVESAVPPLLSQKELSSVRTISRSQNFQRKWCRHVCIVFAIDIVVCLVLFVIWLVICEGTKCLH